MNVVKTQDVLRLQYYVVVVVQFYCVDKKTVLIIVFAWLESSD